MNPVLLSLVVFGSALAASWLLIPAAARLGTRVGLVDHPSSRRTRARPVPTTGGLVIFATVAVSMFLTVRLYADASPRIAREFIVLLSGGSAILILGMLDDRVNLRPWAKLLVQVVVAIGVTAGGVAIERFRFLDSPSIWLGWIRYPLTVFWLVAFMNAVNLIDGLDGLAGGISAIAAIGLFAAGVLSGNPLLYIVAAGLLGSSLGFLLHNYRKGNIYLGDGGSMILGFFLGGGAIIGGRHDAASTAMLVVAACMIVPAFDVFTTMIRRARARRGMMTADRAHVHHRLIRFGLHPKTAVLVLWGVTVFFGGQMLGLVAPHGIVYMLGSYAIAVLVARVVLEQQRKNALTTERRPREDLFYLLGAKDPADGDSDEDGMTLRQMIVAQLRREVEYRRLARGSGRAPRPPASGEPRVRSAQEEDEEGTPAPASEPARQRADERDEAPAGKKKEKETVPSR